MEEIKPITPEECKKERILHSTLVFIVNEILREEYYHGETLIIHQKDIVEKFLALEARNGWTKERMDEDNILFIAKYYTAAGWDARYNSPSFGDGDFEPYYTFTSQ